MPAMGTSVRRGDELEAVGQLRDAVAVAHPHVEQAVAFDADAILDVAQQLAVAARADLGIAELVHVARLDGAAELRGHGLHAVADAEHGHAELPDHVLRRAGRCPAAWTRGCPRG